MCDSCSFEVRLNSYLDCYSVYELPDGGHVPIPKRAEWCYHCKTLCAVENLPGIAATRKEVREAKHALSRLLDGLSLGREEMISASKHFAGVRLEPAQRLHYVVSHRRSPPRCLSCGSFEHKELPLPDYPEGKRTTIQIQHPGCGGNFVIDDRCPIMADIRGPDQYFTPDGILIRSVSPS